MSIRKQLEEIIQSGRTASYRGEFYSQMGELPSEAELAKGDKAEEDKARMNIKTELARLASELALLEGSEKESKKETAKKDDADAEAAKAKAASDKAAADKAAAEKEAADKSAKS